MSQSLICHDETWIEKHRGESNIEIHEGIHIMMMEIIGCTRMMEN